MGIEEIEKYARLNNIPIMQKDGILFMIKFLTENSEIKNILEIGTAIGYSSIMMAQVRNDINIITIERDQERYNEAVKNISKFNLDSKINHIYNDAFNIELVDKVDLIFIDAAKSQSIKFFEKFEPLLNVGGYIITDNLNFHGYVNGKEEIKTKNVQGLVKKITKYINYLKTNDNFETYFTDVGDGISISRKI